MKALVLSVVFALTSVVNAVSGNNVKDFAYNSEKQESGVETQTVYKVKEGKYLERHLQYNYTHDEKGRVSAKEILKWNTRKQTPFLPSYKQSRIEYLSEQAISGDSSPPSVRHPLPEHED